MANMKTRCLACVAALVAVTAVLLLGNSCAQAFSLTEVFYVKGCKDSDPPRSTSRCFAGSKLTSEVGLSIRGLNYPTLKDEASGEQLATFRVELVESLPLSALEDQDEHETVPHVRLPCDAVRQSEVFPSQLLSCTLHHPLADDPETDSETAAFPSKEEALTWWQSAGGSRWFDVVVQVLVKGEEEGDNHFQELAVLRRGVEIDVSGFLRAHSIDVKGASSSRNRAYNVSTHPLERLYTSKPKSQPESSLPDVGEEDYLWVELGIGGLKKELRELFRRVFLSRLPSLADLTEALDIQHVRGVILYGPPGNGKSLIARSLFKLLGPDTRLTVVNAADVLSKFVGESEKNLRDAFGGISIGSSSRAETARKDGKDVADPEDDKSDDDATAKSLHVLVIDEFESLFRRRGYSEDESSAKAVYDGVTNTLLSLMDGVENRNDLLVVGLTNRLQSIDSAMLRPGRFEVLIEVPSPDVPAREEIFFIHTAKLREEGFLAADVDLHDLAERTGGFSGSDIAGTVRSATSHALLRFRQEQADAEGEDGEEEDAAAAASHCKSAATIVDDPPSCGSASRSRRPGKATFEVMTQDLDRAIMDIRSAKDETSSLTYWTGQGDEVSKAVDYDGSMEYRTRSVSRLVSHVTKSRRVYTGVVGLAGASGTGKSFAARQLTTVYPFDTVRYLSCRRLVELRDRGEQLEQVRDALGEASRVRSGLVVLDDFDVLLDSFGGYPVYEATLKNMLYEYRNRPRGVSRSLQGTKDSAREASETGGGGITVNAGSSLHDERNRRFLILTSTRQDALAAAEPDLRLRVRAIHRAGLVELLAHYNISSVSNTRKWQLIRGYPPTISYRNFLRVTDLSLWALEGDVTRKAKGLTAFGSSHNPFLSDAASGGESPKKAGGGGGYLIVTPEQANEFTEALTAVVSSMSLSDSFTGWYNRLPRTDLYEEQPQEEAGQEAEESERTPGVNEADEAAADVGVETMW